MHVQSSVIWDGKLGQGCRDCGLAKRDEKIIENQLDVQLVLKALSTHHMLLASRPRLGIGGYWRRTTAVIED